MTQSRPNWKIDVKVINNIQVVFRWNTVIVRNTQKVKQKVFFFFLIRRNKTERTFLRDSSSSGHDQYKYKQIIYLAPIGFFQLTGMCAGSQLLLDFKIDWKSNKNSNPLYYNSIKVGFYNWCKVIFPVVLCCKTVIKPI